MRLIDADALIRRFKTASPMAIDGRARQIVEEMPTIEERKTGKWIDYTDEGYIECPFCHSATNCEGDKEELYYCFSCGARMESENNG